MKIKTKFLATIVLYLSTFVLTNLLLTNCYAASLVENFDDGFIDSNFWNVSGDGITESGGTLNLSRNNNTDSISSVNSFSGGFDIRFDIMLENILWNDMFHGVSLIDSSGNGISFGFSQYKQFYSAQHFNNGTNFYYTGGIIDPPAFSTNTWYDFQLVSNFNGNVNLYVDNSLLFTRDFSYVSGFTINIPGFYNDGDGSGNGDNNTTNSKIDNLSFTTVPAPAPVPVPASILLLSSGLISLAGIFGFSKNREKYSCTN